MDMQKFWEEYYQKNKQPFVEPDEVMVDVVSKLRPGKAADLGAGDGNNSLWLAEQGWQVTAVDFSPTAIKYINNVARERGLSIHTQVDDITTFVPKEKQDLILLGFIHVEATERKRLLDHVTKALAPNGVLLYLGITDVKEDPGHGIDPGIFAHADEIVADINGLVVIKSGEKLRYIDLGDGEGETEVTGVVVIARKESTGNQG